MMGREGQGPSHPTARVSTQVTAPQPTPSPSAGMGVGVEGSQRHHPPGMWGKSGLSL